MCRHFELFNLDDGGFWTQIILQPDPLHKIYFVLFYPNFASIADDVTIWKRTPLCWPCEILPVDSPHKGSALQGLVYFFDVNLKISMFKMQTSCRLFETSDAHHHCNIHGIALYYTVYPGLSAGKVNCPLMGITYTFMYIHTNAYIVNTHTHTYTYICAWKHIE